MFKPSQVLDFYSGKHIARNTLYNFIGMGLPLVAALLFIPPLINGFGAEKFGILNLAWIVIGYLSFFDFGIGRTLTKIVAEKLGQSLKDDIPGIFWTSIFLMLGVSLLGSLLFFLLTPYIVSKVFNISLGLQKETLQTFYLLAFTIPVVTTSAGLRGVLEAYQKFGVINIIRVILGIFTFLGPLLCLIFTKSLFWVVLVLLIFRVILWILYFWQCLITVPKLKEVRLDISNIKPIIQMSGWITVTNLLAPLITYLDRVLIGSILTATALTYYATPFEIVNRLLLIPTALITVLFPLFSASFLNNPELSKKLFYTGIKYILLFIFPLILLVITFADQGMNLWLGKQFAERSSLVLQLLALGILFNSIGFFPFTFLQGTGKAQITGIIHLSELPVYVLFMWVGIKYYGIQGAALVFFIRMIADSSLLLFFSNKMLRFSYKPKHLFYIIFITVSAVVPIFLEGIIYRLFWGLTTLSLFTYINWRYILQPDEKLYLLNFSMLNKIRSNA